MKLIRSIHEISPKTDDMTENNIVEQEIKTLKELFDKKKSIAIPKVAVQGSKPGISMNDEYSNSTFERPDKYITYGELKRDETITKFKEYEATLKEIDYLKKNDPSISVEQYEQAITALENDVEKGEMIPKERAIVVVTKALPNRDNDTYEKIFEVSLYINYIIIYTIMMSI
jgi:hypothetical protein